MSRKGVMKFLSKLAADRSLQVGLQDSLVGKRDSERLDSVVSYAKTLDCEFTSEEYAAESQTDSVATTMLGGVAGSGGSEWDTKLPGGDDGDGEGGGG